MAAETTLAWLRRDLRLHDQPVLAEAIKAGKPLQPVFIFDKDILARFNNPEDRRISFIVSAAQKIHQELRKRGGGLLTFYGRPIEIWKKLPQALCANLVVASEDYEPATRKRDDEVGGILGNRCEFRLVKDHVIMTPREVLKDDGTPYKVFTPYSRRWLERLSPVSAAPYETSGAQYADYESSLGMVRDAGLEPLDMEQAPKDVLAAIGYKEAAISLWPVGEGQRRLAGFSGKIAAYENRRDFPGEEGTSRLSPYIRFGLISIRECLRTAQQATQSECWIKELIWRDFYHMILYYFPISSSQEFNPVYRGRLGWNNNQETLERFKQGMTGYPIVDAAMRELLQTGWMHNRSRMIVASFMTKDLLLDWRLGEEHFAQHLMDYEMASNVGGWQWAASTGTDAQPYFRIFNPVLQSKKFDPDGNYIRKYIPEIAHLSSKEIHEPWKKARPAGYPLPIVDHDEARVAALKMFKHAEMENAQ